MFKEILGEAFPIIEKVAPVIASVIGSPVAGAATMIGLNILGNAFDVDPGDIKKLSDVIVSNPHAPDRIASLESQFSEFLQNNISKIPLPAKINVNFTIEWQTSPPSN